MRATQNRLRFRFAASLLGLSIYMVAGAARADSAPTEWCSVTSYARVVYFNYCGVYSSAGWHIDRFDLATNQWLAPILSPATQITSLAAGPPGLLVGTYDGVFRYQLDGSSPGLLPNTEIGVSSMGMDGSILFTSGYCQVESYDLILQQVISTPNNIFYAYPTTFVVDAANNRLLGLSEGNPQWPATFSYDTHGVLQTTTENYYLPPFTGGSRNYLTADGKGFINSGGAIFTADPLDEIAWLGGPFDDLVRSGSTIVVLRYDTLVRIDASTYHELGRLKLDHTYSDLALDGTDVVAFYSFEGVAHSRRVPIASIVPQTLPPPVAPTDHSFLASKIQLDSAGILYLLVGDDSVIHRYNLATKTFMSSIALPERAMTFTVDPTNGRVFVGLQSPAVGIADPGAVSAKPLTYSRQTIDEMTVIGNLLYTSEPDFNWEQHEVRSTTTGAILSSSEGRTPSPELVWDAANRHVYYLSHNQSPENIYWDIVDNTGTITDGDQSTYFGDPLDALPPVRPDPTNTFLVLGSGQMLSTATMQLRAQTLPDAPADVAWLGNTMYAAVANGSSGTMLRRYTSTFGVDATAYALGTPQRLFKYASNTLVLVSQWNGGTLVTFVPSTFSDSDFSVASLGASALAGQPATVTFEFRNQGPAGPTSASLSISPSAPLGVIDWTCSSSTAATACGSAATFNATRSIAAGDWLRVTGTFATTSSAPALKFTATVNAGGADSNANNNTATTPTFIVDEIFDGTFE